MKITNTKVCLTLGARGGAVVVILRELAAVVLGRHPFVLNAQP